MGIEIRGSVRILRIGPFINNERIRNEEMDRRKGGAWSPRRGLVVLTSRWTHPLSSEPMKRARPDGNQAWIGLSSFWEPGSNEVHSAGNQAWRCRGFSALLHHDAHFPPTKRPALLLQFLYAFLPVSHSSPRSPQDGWSYFLSNE